jgi:hypothetical protein
MDDPIISVQLRRSNVLTRWPCLFCGGSSGKESWNADVFSAVVNVRPGQAGSDWTGYVVCAQCLAKNKHQLVETIHESAAWHRERAAELEEIAANMPPLPTPAEWSAANRAEDAMYDIPEGRPL